jgi:hypothetical protein
MGNRQITGPVPTIDNSRGYPTLQGAPQSLPLNTNSASAYLAVDFNFPLVEYTAKLNDDILSDLVNIANLTYNQQFTLDGIKNTTPLGDTLQLYNLVIKNQSGYTRLLYNYALPLLQLGTLIAKNNNTAQPNPSGQVNPINPITDNMISFFHTAVLKTFEIMIQEGRTYNEMSMQVFGNTKNDGLDWENKCNRLQIFWNDVWSIHPNDQRRFEENFTTTVQGPLKPLCYITIDSGGHMVTPLSTITQWGDPISGPIPNTIIGYFKLFTQDSALITTATALYDPGTLYNKSVSQTLDFMKSIIFGTYSNNEGTLMGVPPLPNVVSYRNCYSLNPTISYNNLIGPFPIPPAPQYPKAITFGDYLLIFIWRLFHLNNVPNIGFPPGRPSDVLALFLPTSNRSASEPYKYLDYIPIVNAISNYITTNGLESVNYDTSFRFNSFSDPNITPPLSTSPPTQTPNPVPDTGFSTMAIFFPGNDFSNILTYPIYPTPLYAKGLITIFDDIKTVFPDVITLLNRIFRMNPPLTPTASFTITTTNPVPNAAINNATNFYQQQAVRNMWMNSFMTDTDFIYDPADNDKCTDTGILANKVLAFTIFSIITQEYVNIKSVTLSGNITNYLTTTSNTPLPGNKYTFTGDLLNITKITLALLDNIYVYFIDKFSTSTMESFNNVLIENNPPDPIIQPPIITSNTYSISALARSLGIQNGVNPTGPNNITFDPINYMSYNAFALLVTYNYDFVRELIQDLTNKYVLSPAFIQYVLNPSFLPTLLDAISKNQIMDLERRIHSLMPVSGYDSTDAFNPFNVYKNNGPQPPTIF